MPPPFPVGLSRGSYTAPLPRHISPQARSLNLVFRSKRARAHSWIASWSPRACRLVVSGELAEGIPGQVIPAVPLIHHVAVGADTQSPRGYLLQRAGGPGSPDQRSIPKYPLPLIAYSSCLIDSQPNLSPRQFATEEYLDLMTSPACDSSTSMSPPGSLSAAQHLHVADILDSRLFGYGLAQESCSWRRSTPTSRVPPMIRESARLEPATGDHSDPFRSWKRPILRPRYDPRMLVSLHESPRSRPESASRRPARSTWLSSGGEVKRS